jgi:dihydrofolate reductase
MKTILYMAISINGFVAGENDDTSWVSKEDWNSFIKIASGVGNVIIGRRTYEVMSDRGELDNFKGLNVIVVTDGELSGLLKFVVTAKSPMEALEKLQSKGFEKALVAGGGGLNSSFLKGKLIDEIYVDIEPQILGKGIHLFESSAVNQKLKFLEVNKLGKNSIQLHYKIERAIN